MLKITPILIILSILTSAFPLFSPVSPAMAQTSTSFTDTDWSGNNFESQSNIDVSNSSGQLLLKNDPSNMVSAFSVLKNIYDMVVYKDKLIIADCTSLYLTSDAFVHSYDYQTNNVIQIYSYAEGMKEQGIQNMYVFNDKLYIPGADRDDGGWDLGAIYIYDGATWTRKLTVPNDLHGFDMAYYKGKLYINFSYNAQSVRLYESANDGDSWTNSNTSMTSSMYARRLLLYNDKLAVFGDATDRLWIYDGVTWQKNTSFPQLTMFSHAIFNNKIYWAGYLSGPTGSLKGLFYTSDLATAGSVAYFINKGISDLIVYENKLYAIEHIGASGKIHYSLDGSTWSSFSQNIPITTYPSHLQQYRGRLYLGNGPNVYVSTAASSGNLVSKPINMFLGDATVSWDGLAPVGTSLKFQVRSAQTSAGLAAKSFIGPDGTEATYYTASGTALNSVHSGDSWVQYKVFMATSDPKFTPYLNSFTLTSSPVAPPPVNNSPVLNAIGNKSVEEGKLLSFNLSATDSDGDTLTYAASSLPSGATLTGTAFSWTSSFTQAGSYNITFSVSDARGGTDSETINITVNDVVLDITPPVRSNGQPTGILPVSTTQTTISLTTNENAVCRHATSSGMVYDLMT